MRKLLLTLALLAFGPGAFAQTVFPNIDVRGTIVNNDSGEAVTINDNAVVTGTSNLQGAVTMAIATATGNLDLQGAISNSTGNLTLNDTVDVSGALNVTGLGTFNTLTVTTCTGCVSGGGGATLSGNNTFTGNNAFNTGTFTIGSLTGILQGNGSSPVSVITNSSTVGQTLRVTGAATYAWGALDLADTDAVTGILPVANGGLNLSAATDDNTVVGNGTTWQSKAIPDCDDSGGSHLNYDTTTNAFTCGTSGDGAGTGTAGGSDTQVQYNDAGAFGGDAGLTFNETTNDLTVGGLVNAVGALFTSAVELTYSTARVIIDDSSGTNNSCVQFQDNNVTQGFVCSANAAGQVANSSNAGDIVIRADNGGELIWTPDSGSTTVDMTPTFGTFEAVWTNACTTSPSQTWIYYKIGKMVTLQAIDNVSCTGDSTAFDTAGTDLPSALRPTGTLLGRTFKGARGLDNGTGVSMCLIIGTSGSFTLVPETGGACGGNFTASGTRFFDASGGTGQTSWSYVLE